MPGREEEIRTIYRLLDDHFGDLRWWPADDPFEMMVGAILTQNTAWRNVEKALIRLRERALLAPEAIAASSAEVLADAVRPSGYYHLKAARLQAFARFFLAEYAGSVAAMRASPLVMLRERLLHVRGVGPETADSILLYACEKPSFVSDAYTERILLRHGLLPEKAGYPSIRDLFMRHLPPDVPLFKQYHALLVLTGKTFCRRQAPLCAGCPLVGFEGNRQTTEAVGGQGGRDSSPIPTTGAGRCST
jgi:endonuclease-3 related protein